MPMWNRAPVPFASIAPLMASLIMVGTVAWADPAEATAADLYYERSVAVAAQSKCQLFEPGVAAALSAATLQARGAALRSGVEASQLAASSTRARARVDQVSCQDAQLRLMASRVEAGFAGWSRAARISFAGDRSAWHGDRFESKQTGWRLAQDALTGTSPVRLGLVGRSPSLVQLATVVSFKGRNRPYAARLVVRNATALPRPWLSGEGLPPPSAQMSFFATGVSAAPAPLLKTGERQGEQWLFAHAAIEAMARLDPRETVRIEFLFRDDSVASAQFEVGDFAAGRAFLNMGPI
jgi:hypothetical protein